jgi:hypothetical protein
MRKEIGNGDDGIDTLIKKSYKLLGTCDIFHYWREGNACVDD